MGSVSTLDSRGTLRFLESLLGFLRHCCLRLQEAVMQVGWDCKNNPQTSGNPSLLNYKPLKAHPYYKLMVHLRFTALLILPIYLCISLRNKHKKYTCTYAVK